MMENSTTFGPQLEWLFQHASLVGWPTFCYFVWKASRFVSETTNKALHTADQVNTLATEHFPTIRESLQKQDQLLTSIDKNMETVAQGLPLYTRERKKKAAKI